MGSRSALIPREYVRLGNKVILTTHGESMVMVLDRIPAVIDESLVIRVDGIMKDINKGQDIPIEEIYNDIIPIIHEASLHADIDATLQYLRHGASFVSRHSIGVTVLAYHIGRLLRLSESKLKLLSAAALLHDIGMLEVPSSMLTNIMWYQPHEYAVVQQHAMLGHRVLSASTRIDPVISLVALQHHERRDGTGYPSRLREGIHQFSEIIAVADIYLAMLSNRPHRGAFSFYQVVRELQNQMYNKLNPEIVTLFLNNMLSTKVGKEVLLTDDTTGTIIYVSPNNLLKPIVDIQGKLVDLSKTKGLDIKDILG